jgi:transcriptional regulator with XRE-family HTH domain
MDVIDRLRAAVKASGMKQNHIAHLAGVQTPKLSKILNGKQVPTVHEFIAIAAAINLDPGRLFSDSEIVMELNDLRAAHAATQSLHRILSGYLPDAAPAGARPITLVKPAPRMSARPLRAAATSNVELYPEVEKERQRIPRRAWNRGARMTARAVGDSMSGPGVDSIADGELVFVRPTRNRRAANGKIVVCSVGDAIYLKQLQIVGRTVRLVSLNPAHEPIELDAPAEFRLIGIAVDHAAPL